MQFIIFIFYVLRFGWFYMLRRRYFVGLRGYFGLCGVHFYRLFPQCFVFSVVFRAFPVSFYFSSFWG